MAFHSPVKLEILLCENILYHVPKVPAQTHTGTRTHTVNQGHMKDRQRHHFKWFNTNSWKKTFKLSFSKVLPK